MKTFARTLLTALLVAVAPIATAGTFSSEKIISTDPSLGSQFPQIAYSGSTVHITWVGYAPGMKGDIFYSRSTNNGGTFSAPVNLSSSATAAIGTDQPQVTAGANGVYVAWHVDGGAGGSILVRRSTDGGANFGAAVQIASSAGGFYTRITDLFTDPSGGVHMVYYTNEDTAGASGMVHHRVTCDGANWGPNTAVTSQSIDGDVDNEEPRLGAVGSRIFVTYRSSRNGNPQGGFAPYSIQMQSGTVNGGCAIAWSYPARRMGGGIPFSYGSSFRPAIFGDAVGTMHLAWWDLDRGANVAYRFGNPATGAYAATKTVSNLGVDHPEPGGLTSTPGAAAGGLQAPPGLTSNGTSAFLAYQRNQTALASFESGPVYLRESADNGANFGPELPVSGANAGTTPRLAIGGPSNQNVAIAWSDIRSGTATIYFRLYTLGAVSGSSFSLSPGSFNFGSKQVATTSTTVLTLLNSGAAGNISSIVGSGDFSIQSTTCGATLGAGASCTVTARFIPAALGARSGTITASTDAFDSPSTSALSGTGTPSTGSSAFNDNVNAVVTGYYETILGRSPDGPGATFWSGEATRVSGLGADVREVFYAMSMQFFESAEYLNKATSDTQYITDLYRTFFIRDPDAAGLSFWLSQIAGGMDRGSVLNNFLFSTEFSNQMTTLFGTSSPRPEINLTIDLYRGILGGLPDSGGFNFWLGQVRAAQCSGSAAVKAKISELGGIFVGSAQYQGREAARPAGERTKRHVSDLYNAFLRRGADLGGYNFWVNQITSAAQTRDQVRQAYIDGAEFQARVNAVIAAGCFP